MGTITTTDGVEIFYKDWGSGQPIVFSHGWPLSADDWDAQLMFFLPHGYRVIAHDRRGHGRSTQTADGHDMDHYADDLAALDRAPRPARRRPRRPLHRRRRGRALHRPARREPRRQGRADQRRARRSWCRPRPTPAACPRASSTASRSRWPPTGRTSTATCPSTAFYGFNRAGVEPSEAIIAELVAPGHDGRRQGPLRRHRRVLADRLHRGPEEDHRAGAGHARRRRPGRPVRRLRAAVGEAACRTARSRPTPGFPHGMPTTQAATINADLLEFLRS